MLCLSHHRLSKAFDCVLKLDAQPELRRQAVGLQWRPACGLAVLGVRLSRQGAGRQTLPVTARHWDGALEYDMHNLYGHSMALATHSALQAVTGRRPFILTRRAAAVLAQSPCHAWRYTLAMMQAGASLQMQLPVCPCLVSRARVPPGHCQLAGVSWRLRDCDALFGCPAQVDMAGHRRRGCALDRGHRIPVGGPALVRAGARTLCKAMCGAHHACTACWPRGAAHAAQRGCSSAGRGCPIALPLDIPLALSLARCSCRRRAAPAAQMTRPGCRCAPMTGPGCAGPTLPAMERVSAGGCSLLTRRARGAPRQSVLLGGMAGISLIGADICGFQGYPSEELCARWAAAGAWQPLARAHHANGYAELFRRAGRCGSLCRVARRRRSCVSG